MRLRFPLSSVVASAVAGFTIAAALVHAAPFDVRQRSVSASGQFIVFSTDVPLRSRVASFADEVRLDFQRLIEARDRQGRNIVITLDRATSPTQPPVEFTPVEVKGGFKVQIDVHIGDRPADINLQKHIIRALILEYAYRDKPEGVKGGQPYAEPPWWLVEGAIQIIRKRDAGVDAELFKRIIDTNKLPALDRFLGERRAEVESATALAVDQGCAMCLVQSLIDQPTGRENLARFIRHLQDANPNPVAALLRDFPSLAGEESLQKWWTLTLARFSATDRFQGLSTEETESELQAALQFELPTGKGDEKKTFAVGDFDEYLKLSASHAALVAAEGNLVSLSAHANPLYRTVIADYEQAVALLARGKTRGIKDRLTRSAHYREAVARRTSDIADYLNWFEATQTGTRSDAFDGYLKAANELATPLKHDDPISKYLDELAREL